MESEEMEMFWFFDFDSSELWFQFLNFTWSNGASHSVARENQPK